MYDGEVDVPRLLRWYAESEPLPHEVLTEARAMLSRHYAAELGEPFRTAGMCLYRDGRDSVAWHGDTVGRGGSAAASERSEAKRAVKRPHSGGSADTMVAIVSFGSPRPLLLRPRGGGTSLRFPLGHGDLVVMGGSCQRTWEHAIPKTARTVGPRVSVQFRPAGVA
jgi:alkylated DNA repair dioxygenase AlkB